MGPRHCGQLSGSVHDPFVPCPAGADNRASQLKTRISHVTRIPRIQLIISWPEVHLLRAFVIFHTVNVRCQRRVVQFAKNLILRVQVFLQAFSLTAPHSSEHIFRHDYRMPPMSSLPWLADFIPRRRTRCQYPPQRLLPDMRLVPQRNCPMRKTPFPSRPICRALKRTEHASLRFGIDDSRFR